MSRRLDDLDPRMRFVVVEFLARCVEAKIPILILDTIRTNKEQEANIAKGVSWTKNSKHLPRRPSGKSYAIDVAPYYMFNMYGPDKLQWDGSDPVWQRIGAIGEGLGLVWGGRWKKKDMGHFEHPKAGELM